jgi:putative addiction module antidote
METKIRKIGNSLGILLPKDILEAMGVGAGDSVDVSVKDKKISLLITKK